MKRNLTYALLKVALALMQAPSARHWGYELTKETGLRSGVVYPMLTRMIEDGWLSDGWEDPQSITEKRPPRRYYEITDVGLRELGAVIARAENDARFSSNFNVSEFGFRWAGR